MNPCRPGMPIQVTPRKREYCPFTREAAARVAKEFGIEEGQETLFKLVTGMSETYERYRLMPDYQQRKDALKKLRKAVHEVARVAAKHQRALEFPLEMTLLPRLLGELLTYEGIEKLLGRRVTRRPLPPAKASWDDYDERTRLDRSIHASRAGPKLLISLLGEMRSAIDQPLASGPPHKGGHPIKHLYRHAIAMELAMHYHWFFEEYPTTAPTGQFARFCVAVLNELECDTTGFEKTLPDILDDAATNFVPNYSPRSRRRISSRK